MGLLSNRARCGRARTGWAGLVTLAALWWSGGIDRAQPSPASLPEVQVQAAFVYNFAKFVDWPGKAESRDAPLLIGVAGDSTLAAALEALVSNKTVGERRLLVRRVEDPRDLATYNIAFLGWPERDRIKKALETLQGEPVLTVSQCDAFAQSGGIIGLIREDHKMRFDINQEAAEQAGLRLSAKLLALARVVVRAGDRGH